MLVFTVKTICIINKKRQILYPDFCYRFSFGCIFFTFFTILMHVKRLQDSLIFDYLREHVYQLYFYISMCVKLYFKFKCIESFNLFKRRRVIKETHEGLPKRESFL